MFRNGNSQLTASNIRFAMIKVCQNVIAQAALNGGSRLGGPRRLFLHITGSSATTEPHT